MNCKLFVFLFSFSMIISSCVKENDDENPPEIGVSYENPMSNDTIFMDSPENLNFTYTSTDEEGLNSLRFYISKKSELESHSCTLNDEYSYLEIFDVSGTENLFSRNVVLEDSIYGVYSIDFNVLDSSGNLNSSDLTLVVSNSNLPVVDSLITIPSRSGCDLTLSSDLVELNVTIQATCDLGIGSVHYYWLEGEELLSEEVTLLNGSTEINENVTLNIPDSTSEELTLKIKITSSTGIPKWLELEVSISE